MKKVSSILFVFITIIVSFILFSCCSMNAQWEMTDQWRNEIVGKYPKAVEVQGIDVIKQDVSCGYAVIEMFSQWTSSQGTGDFITEEMLQKEYGKVVTSTGKNFSKEMNKRFPHYNTTMYKDLSCEDFIIKAYDSLERGIPVPFEWAAKLNDEWTLHYSLLIGIDVPNDKITVLNPYGYKEEITMGEFFKRTSFEAFENMPFYFSFGFSFGIFEKNALFIVTEK